MAVVAMAPHLHLSIALIADRVVSIQDADDPVCRLALELAAVIDGFVLALGDGAIVDRTGAVLASFALRTTVADPTCEQRQPSGDPDDVER